MRALTNRRDIAKAFALVPFAAAAGATQAYAQARTPAPNADVDAAVRAAHQRYSSLNEGANADYIPALAQVPSHYFGVSLVTTDGGVHSVGDDQQAFSIQSISKVFTM